MENNTLQIISILRWINRILTAIAVTYFLVIFIGESMQGTESGTTSPITNSEILQLTLMGIGLFGLIAAWIWELLGGVIGFFAFLILIFIHPSVFSAPLIIYPLLAIFL
jgi:hypothetical protein